MMPTAINHAPPPEWELLDAKQPALPFRTLSAEELARAQGFNFGPVTILFDSPPCMAYSFPLPRELRSKG